MKTAPNVIYEFGPYRIDPDRETLLRDGHPLAITPKAFEVLLALVRRSHEVVAKDELLQAVWPGRVIEEANLSQCIFVLRKLLGDTPDERRYIVTLPGKGYRFAAPVRTLASDQADANVASPPDSPGIGAAVAGQSAGSQMRSNARKLVFAAIGVLIVAVALGTTYVIERGAPNEPTAGIPAKSIAVLPFQNLSADKNNEYFVAGVQGLILTKLADIGDLKVIARTSISMYASHPDDLETIGQQLGVATILEGSVQKAGNQVLINLQLIDCKTDSPVWAKSYTRTLTNVFGVEGEVAESVAAALNAKLSPAQSGDLATVPTSNRDAYDAFLRAEYQADQGDTEYDLAHWKAAIPLYRRAVQEDPGFAVAWARLSYNESVLAWFGGGGEDVRQLNHHARADAERALNLAPNLAAARIAIGYCDYLGRGDYAAGLKAFAMALKLKPNDAKALAAQSFVQRRMGRIDAAIASLDRALTFDPRDSALAFALGVTYMMASRYPDAEQAFQRALAIEPHSAIAKANFAAAILFDTGDIPRAQAALQGDEPALKSMRAGLLVLQRKYTEAFALLDSIPDTPDVFSLDGGSKARNEADLLWTMGDTARARPLFAQDLAMSKAQLKVQQGINLAFVWIAIGDDDLGLGHAAEGLDAVANVRAIIARNPDRTYGPTLTESAAGIYAKAGRADLAVPLLAKALVSPGIGTDGSPVLLWLAPVWDPIRADPRFQALLKQYAKYKPAVVYPVPLASASTATRSASVSASSAR